jgi:hypothetical protein
MLQPWYNLVVGVVTTSAYLVTTKLLVTTPLSMGCKLSVRRFYRYRAHMASTGRDLKRRTRFQGPCGAHTAVRSTVQQYIHGLSNGKTVTNRPRRGGGLTGGSIGTAPTLVTETAPGIVRLAISAIHGLLPGLLRARRPGIAESRFAIPGGLSHGGSLEGGRWYSWSAFPAGLLVHV